MAARLWIALANYLLTIWPTGKNLMKRHLERKHEEDLAGVKEKLGEFNNKKAICVGVCCHNYYQICV